MPDYGRSLHFGISLAPNASDWPDLLAAAQAADEAGLEFLGVQDHPYQRRFLDTTALLAAIAASTQRLRVFHDVVCLPLRPPAILANEAASIDIMSRGRFELGLGAGAFWDAIEAMGGPRRSPGEALAALEEAIDIIRLLWSGERGLRYEGEHYRVDGIHSGPLPAHDIEIWLGVLGPRALALLGRKGDGWLPSLGRVPLEELGERHAIIDEAARAEGRNPADIRRLVNINGEITDGPGDEFLVGTAEQWVEQLTSLAVDHGFDTFIFWPGDDTIAQIERFAAVTETVRESVAAARG